VHPGPFHPILDDMTASAFDHARGDGVAGGEVSIIVNAVAVAVEIAVNLLQAGAGGDGQLALFGEGLCCVIFRQARLDKLRTELGG
jgi:hypothetical protein